MSDRIIRRFQFKDIEIDDDARLVQARQTYQVEMNAYMRDQGYVPIIDISPVWRSEYVDGKYRCSYTHQGVYVGDESWQINYIMDNKPIPKTKSTPSSKI